MRLERQLERSSLDRWYNFWNNIFRNYSSFEKQIEQNLPINYSKEKFLVSSSLVVDPISLTTTLFLSPFNYDATIAQAIFFFFGRARW